jgi:hypothetical protein
MGIFLLRHALISLIRCRARSISSAGVFCVFLINPCTTPIRPSSTKNSNRAIRRLGRRLRTSHRPSPQRPAQRHADRPAELHGGEVDADRAPVFGRKVSQPLKHRLRSARRAIENDWYLGQAWRIKPSSRSHMNRYAWPSRLPAGRWAPRHSTETTVQPRRQPEGLPGTTV